MMRRTDITQWGIDHPWQNENQIEQDLLLSMTMVEVANDPLLGHELVLRGGTAFHKLFLPEPYRYSEDLDFVRTSAGGIGDVMKRLTSLGRDLGFDVRTKMGEFPKVYWRFAFEDGTPGKIKLEINTYERSPMMPLAKREYSVVSRFYAGKAEIPTFQPEELVATKLRALYQRKKGRDLYDLWLALTVLNLDPKAIVAAFPAYRPEGADGKLLAANLAAKLEDKTFCTDVNAMVRIGSPAYDPQEAGRIVSEKILRLIV
jgi:predicted nucleotidyltransferase component of viral defense system